MSVDAITFENLVDFIWNGETGTSANGLLHPFVQADDIQKFISDPGEYQNFHSDWYNKHEPKYNLDEGNHEYNPYGRKKNDNFEIGDLVDELPEYNLDDMKGDTDPFDYFKYYRWAINALIVGIPWTTTALLSLGYNLYFNISWNKFWASGNSYLVLNTVYLFIQVVNSIPLVFELPIWLRAFRVTRMLSFLSAIIYTIVYFISFLEWYDQIWLVTDKSNYDFVTIMVNMLLGYHLVLHSSIIPVNIAIIVKELSLNIFSVSGKKRENEAATYLNMDDLKEAEKDINPVTYVDDVWEPAFGYDVEDYVIENPKDEEHYIGNWGKNKK